jgi:hypothetical protein
MKLMNKEGKHLRQSVNLPIADYYIYMSYR